MGVPGEEVAVFDPLFPSAVMLPLSESGDVRTWSSMCRAGSGRSRRRWQCLGRLTRGSPDDRLAAAGSPARRRPRRLRRPDRPGLAAEFEQTPCHLFVPRFHRDAGDLVDDADPDQAAPSAYPARHPTTSPATGSSRGLRRWGPAHLLIMRTLAIPPVTGVSVGS